MSVRPPRRGRLGGARAQEAVVSTVRGRASRRRLYLFLMASDPRCVCLPGVRFVWVGSPAGPARGGGGGCELRLGDARRDGWGQFPGEADRDAD